MARIRTVKPRLFRSERLYSLEKETGLPIRLAWIGMFTVADREGRFLWRANEIKLDVLPWDETDFETILSVFEEEGMVLRYEAEGKIYGYIPTWHDHQSINNREQDSEIPPPSEGTILSNPVTRGARVEHATQDAPQGEGKGREGKGRTGHNPIALLELWNEVCDALPKVIGFSEKRKRSAKARLSENPDLEYWRDIFTRMNASSFCRGEENKKDKDWKANIEFALRSDTHIRVLEGQYGCVTAPIQKQTQWLGDDRKDEQDDLPF